MGKKVQFVGALSVAAALMLAPAGVAQAATISVTADFNAGAELAEQFTVFRQSGTLTQTLDNGILDSGAIYSEADSTYGIAVTKQAFDISGVGQAVTLSAYVHSFGGFGYFTLGITSFAEVDTHTAPSSILRPADAAGYAVHGGGLLSLAEDEEVETNWDSDDATNFDVVHVAPMDNMLGAASSDQWYKIVVMVTRVSDVAVDLNVAAWPAHADGTMVDGATEPMAEFHRAPSAPTVANAGQVYGFLGYSGSRFDFTDNVVITGDAVAGAADGGTVLPDTGSTTLLPGAFAFTSLLAGAVVLVAVRRRQSR